MHQLGILFFLAAPFLISSLETCTEKGIFPGPGPRDFAVCTEKNGVLIRSEHSCCNKTIYSPDQRKCVLPQISRLSFTQSLSLRLSASESMECIKPGIMCGDCQTLQICVGQKDIDGNEIFIPKVAQTCQQDEVCEYKKGCVKTSEGGICNLISFECSEIGTFPDPFDCKKYHVCVPSEGVINKIDIECIDTVGGSYNADFGTCGWPLNSDACLNKPVRFCETEFQMGPVGRGNMFFVCMKRDNGLTPAIFTCPQNSLYNPATYSCENQS